MRFHPRNTHNSVIKHYSSQTVTLVELPSPTPTPTPTPHHAFYMCIWRMWDDLIVQNCLFFFRELCRLFQLPYQLMWMDIISTSPLWMAVSGM